MPDSPTQKIDRQVPDPTGSGNGRPRQDPAMDPENFLFEYKNSKEEISDLKYLISKLTKEKNDVFQDLQARLAGYEQQQGQE